MYEHGMIGPVVGLLFWTMIMLVWLYATRIPAMRQAKIRPGQASRSEMEALPNWASNPAANYNHLHEQPTLFYAACFALEFLGQGNEINVGLAWLYVGLRILHSLVQATANIIIVRWLIFMAASLVLLVMLADAVIVVFGQYVF